MQRVLISLISLTLLVVMAAVAGYVYLRQSLPVADGEIVVSGAAGPVEILRDEFGVPHIHASSREDAYFGLGFAHAQDRLWQMEMNRRIGSGRLAEILGPKALETDRFLRTLGIRRVAEANLKHVAPDTLAALEAYAAGVNAFLATDPVLPPEFWIFGVEPEPWTPVDSVAWSKMMAWDLGGNWRAELLRERLSRTLTNERINEFLPPYPGDPAPRLPDLKKLYESLGRIPITTSAVSADGFSSVLELTENPAADITVGSNAWAVSGERTVTGKPLLANDPHLGLTAPPVWYLAHLSAPGLEAIGGTLPGAPAVVVGRNDRIAWGFTNTGPDVQDLYLEKLDEAGRYLTPQGYRAFEVREETIRVKGERDERIRIRVSRHGPVISDVLPMALEAAPRRHVVAMAWTALAEDDLTVQAGLRLATARDWKSFLAAAREFHAPQQNMVYADVDGNIGFVAAGRVPVRRAANDLKGLAPAPGWEARYDWAGYLPFDELPRAFNPPSHAIVTANHKIVPPGYPHHITLEWQPPYRAERIEALLGREGLHSARSFASIQMDVVSLAARALLKHVLSIEASSEEGQEALRLLAGWDGTMAADRAEPLIFVAWWREIARAVYADELGDAFLGSWSARPVFLERVFSDEEPFSRWCDDVRTPARESCPQILAQALERALLDLRKRYGSDMEDWRWGEAHVAHHKHRPLTSGGFLARFFDIRVPSAGDAFTVNVGRSEFANEAEPYASRHAPSLRAVYDLADLESSVFIQSGGQSGNPLSRHYRAFAEAWSKGAYVPMVTDRSRLEAAGVQRLVLMPRR